MGSPESDRALEWSLKMRLPHQGMFDLIKGSTLNLSQ